MFDRRLWDILSLSESGRRTGRARRLVSFEEIAGRVKVGFLLDLFYFVALLDVEILESLLFRILDSGIPGLHNASRELDHYGTHYQRYAFCKLLKSRLVRAMAEVRHKTGVP